MARQAADELIADFLLRYYRQPARYRAQAQRATHLFGNLDMVLRLALGRRVELAAPELRTTAASAELRRAAVFCIQQQFFREEATHYEVLGLATDASPASIRENFRLLMQLIHPDRQGASANWSESCAARVNRAHAVLRAPANALRVRPDAGGVAFAGRRCASDRTARSLSTASCTLASQDDGRRATVARMDDCARRGLRLEAPEVRGVFGVDRCVGADRRCHGLARTRRTG
jgi:hypothetical protein